MQKIDLRYDPIGDAKYPWIVLSPITVILSNNEVITIPVGMRTDLRSSPKWLWSIIPPFCKALLAFLIHDYLYIYDYKVKELGLNEAQKFADNEMKLWCRKLDKWSIPNACSYLGVRIFGHSVFKILRPENNS